MQKAIFLFLVILHAGVLNAQNMPYHKYPGLRINLLNHLGGGIGIPISNRLSTEIFARVAHFENSLFGEEVSKFNYRLNLKYHFGMDYNKYRLHSYYFLSGVNYKVIHKKSSQNEDTYYLSDYEAVLLVLGGGYRIKNWDFWIAAEYADDPKVNITRTYLWPNTLKPGTGTKFKSPYTFSAGIAFVLNLKFK